MNDIDRYRYGTTLGSSSDPEGMYLELWDNESNKLVLWAFYSDTDGSIEFKEYEPDVPEEVQQWFKQVAYERLPPSES